ncbi:MAG: ATP-binding protein [candidate division WOR-3 bacterium]
MVGRKKQSSQLADRLRLKDSELSWRCPEEYLKFRTTEDIRSPASVKPAGVTIVGQERAVEALALGLDIESQGYNIFVTGPSGTGRTTTVRQMLERYKTAPRELDDKCYVNNFRDPDQPRLLRLKPGDGRRFQRDMDQLIEYLAKNVPALFESETYQHSRTEIVDRFKEEGGARVREFEKRVASEGFALVQSAPFARPELAPIVEKQPVHIDSLAGLVEEGKLPAKRAEEIRAKYRALNDELSAIFKVVREQERLAREALRELDENIVRPVLEERLADVAERYPGEKVREYLKEVAESIIGNIDLFRQRPEAKPEQPALDPYAEYRVNVLVDNSGTKGAPVVFETNPNYKNLFGAIERTMDRTGQWHTDFTKIKAGSILRADRGFLVLNALDVLVEPGVWPALKRTLRNRRLEISAYDPFFSLFSTSVLKPEPVAISLKVVMIGDPEIYTLLSAYDEDFKKIFTVRADFDWEMTLNGAAVEQYCQVVKNLCEKEKLARFDRSAVARVIEYGARLAGRQRKLTTRFNVVSEVLKEASYWAKKDGATTVTAKHVDEAIEKRRNRVRLQEEKIQELIDQGTLFIDVTGKAVGQVNGLAVYDSGEYMFGHPTRITAKTGVGASGIINIERESQLSGPIHDKGVYILSGYLRSRFARQQPLVLSASITFEQSYGGVDGDSASSTEVYALLSDLSGLGIRQDLAVTGSVNQQGQIQPVGGVNQKVEGFFYTCRARGLTGRQGVIIPKANVPDLMLRPEVIEAVRKGKFHLYAVETVDQGIELLTGVPAGRPDRKGNYPPDSVNGRVQRRLAELASIYQGFQAEAKQTDESAGRGRPGLRRRTRR